MPMINNVISTTPDYLQGYVGGYPVNVPVGMLVPPVVPRNVVIGNQVVTYNPATATFMAAGGAVAFGSGGGAVASVTRVAESLSIPLNLVDPGSAMPLISGNGYTITTNSTITIAAGQVENGVCVVDFRLRAILTLPASAVFSGDALTPGFKYRVYFFIAAGDLCVVSSKGSALLTEPGQVTGLTLGTATTTTQPLTWTAPANIGNSALTDYLIEYKLAAAGTYTTFAHTASTTTGIVVTGLTLAQSYNYRVSAVNAIGTGIASTVGTGNTAPAYVNQRFANLDAGKITESGTGPYSYGRATAGTAWAASSNLKFPAGVAASLTFKLTVKGVVNSTYSYIVFDTDATANSAVGTPIYVGLLGNDNYISSGVTGSVSAAVGTFMRLRRDAANVLYGEASTDNITWTTINSVAGANVDYWPKYNTDPGTGGQWTFQSFSQTGMV